MYPYQHITPVYYVDPDGELAYPGQIHNLVVNHAAEKHDLYKEQTINYSFGWGRADLISESGFVWDVKRDKKNQISAGVAQVQKYAANQWRNKPETDLNVGYPIAGDSFVAYLGFETYYVTYRYARDGVIAYDYYKVTDWEAIKAGAAALGMAILVYLGKLVAEGSQYLRYIPIM